jgi:hypothetical protein
MKPHELEALAAAYPVDRERIDRLDIESMEADLFADLEEAPVVAEAESRRRPRRRRLGLALAGAALAAAVVAVVVLAGGGAERPSRAYGAELIRFAESTPLLLLEGPGWGVRGVDPGSGVGKIEFAKASPDPNPGEPLMTRADVKRHVMPRAVVLRRQ